MVKLGNLEEWMLSPLFGVEIKVKPPRRLSSFLETGLMALYYAKAKLTNLHFPIA